MRNAVCYPGRSRFFRTLNTDKETLALNSLDEWWGWRHDQDRHDRQQDEQLAAHETAIEVLKTRQQIMADNETARHAKTPQLVVSLVSVGISILFFILQLLLAKGRIP